MQHQRSLYPIVPSRTVFHETLTAFFRKPIPRVQEAAPAQPTRPTLARQAGSTPVPHTQAATAARIPQPARTVPRVQQARPIAQATQPVSPVVKPLPQSATTVAVGTASPNPVRTAQATLPPASPATHRVHAGVSKPSSAVTCVPAVPHASGLFPTPQDAQTTPDVPAFTPPKVFSFRPTVFRVAFCLAMLVALFFLSDSIMRLGRYYPAAFQDAPTEEAGQKSVSSTTPQQISIMP